jgi:hypothetical protein
MTVKGNKCIYFFNYIRKILEGTEIQQATRVADIFAQISCYVCQAASSGIHFGRKVLPHIYIYLFIY